MNTIAAVGYTPSLISTRFAFNYKVPSSSKFFAISLPRNFKNGEICLTATGLAADATPEKRELDDRISLACPVCHEKLKVLNDGTTFADCSSQTKLRCRGCKKSYNGNESHLDLAISAGGKKYRNTTPLITELFRIPLVSFAYERGWRQNFAIGGFPGPEKEFEMMKEYISSASGGNIVDASCGSGLFSRLFSKSGMFSFVVALDFSETMLQQCSEYIKSDYEIAKQNIMLVRSDINRLPFVSGSVDVVHAGAAIHCWSAPVSGVAEICRVLKPGGVFVGSTFIVDGKLGFFPFLGTISQGFRQLSGTQVFLEERELEEICLSCGLVDYKFKRSGQFIMFSAKKLH